MRERKREGGEGERERGRRKESIRVIRKKKDLPAAQINMLYILLRPSVVRVDEL